MTHFRQWYTFGWSIDKGIHVPPYRIYFLPGDIFHMNQHNTIFYRVHNKLYIWEKMDISKRIINHLHMSFYPNFLLILA